MIALFDDAALACIPALRAARPDADAPGHLLAWLASRIEVWTHEMRGKRLDVGNLESYRAAESWLQAAENAPPPRE